MLYHRDKSDEHPPEAGSASPRAVPVVARSSRTPRTAPHRFSVRFDTRARDQRRRRTSKEALDRGRPRTIGKEAEQVRLTPIKSTKVR